jgi:hypothetical protein
MAPPAHRVTVDGPSPPRQRKVEPNTSQRHAAARTKADIKQDKEDPKMIGPWRIGKTIGKGSSGPSILPSNPAAPC